MSEQEFDTDYKESPVCPYCGHVEPDAWEISPEAEATYCGDCGKLYGISQETTRTFSSYKTCQPDEPHTFGDWKTYGPAAANLGETRSCKICGVTEFRK